MRPPYTINAADGIILVKGPNLPETRAFHSMLNAKAFCDALNAAWKVGNDAAFQDQQRKQ